MKLTTKRIQTERKTKFDVEKLQETEERLQYQIEIENRFAVLEDEEEINWDYVKNSMIETAERTVGRSRRRRGNRWFNDECKTAAGRRKVTRIKWIEYRENMEKRRTYTEARNNASRINRRNKRFQIDRELEEIENNDRHGKTRAEFQGINKIRKGYQAKQGMIKNSTGDLLLDKEKVSERWVEHFRCLLNRPPPQEPVPATVENQLPLHGEEVEEPTREEVLLIIRSLKNNKAAGIDEISAELIKYGGRPLHEAMVKIVIGIWRREEMPLEWEEGMFLPIHKKGDRAECSNYRGICLLTVGYKIVTKLIYNRLKRYCEVMVGDYQSGFRTSRSTIDQIFTIRQIMEKCWEYDKETWHAFIDFKQAYDSIHRESMWRILREFRVPEKLLRLIDMCYRDMRCRVKIGAEVTDHFEVNNGLKQGCALSTLLFNLALEWVMRQTPVRNGIHLGDAVCDRLAHADVINVCGESLENISDSLIYFRDSAKQVGLEINQQKTKIMKVTRHNKILGKIR